MSMDVFNRDRGHVHQNADGEREATERHEVDGLAGDPKRQNCAHQCQRDVQHDNQRAAPVAQKQKNHQAGQQRAERAFHRQSGNRAGHVRRLIKFIAHLHVCGHDALKLGQILFDEVDDRERGGIGAFGDRDVHRAASVHQRKAGDDVGSVLHSGEVAEKYRWKNSGTNRHALEVLDVFHD